MGQFSTIPEYEAELAIVGDTIWRELLAGSERSTDSGGGNRSTKEIDFSKLQEYRATLNLELAQLGGCPAPLGGAGF